MGGTARPTEPETFSEYMSFKKAINDLRKKNEHVIECHEKVANFRSGWTWVMITAGQATQARLSTQKIGGRLCRNELLTATQRLAGQLSMV